MFDAYKLGSDFGKLVSHWARRESSARVSEFHAQAIENRLVEDAEPELHLSDIQGNIIPGFNKPFQMLAFINFGNTAAAKRWLSDNISNFTTAKTVLEHKRRWSAEKSLKPTNQRENDVTLQNIAFSSEGLRVLKGNTFDFTDGAFRSRALALPGGRTVRPGGYIATDLEGVPQRDKVHALVIAASDSRTALSRELNSINQLRSLGVNLVNIEIGNKLMGTLAGYEHFGFRDGISQPGIRGLVSRRPHEYLTPRLNPLDGNQGRPGQELVWPGEFIIGYHEEDEDHRYRPGRIATAGPEWAKNGSFLVFLRFRQDVERFRQFLDETAARLRLEYGELSNLSSNALAAKMFGRWQSGAPLVRAPDGDNPPLGGDKCAVNNFSFRRAGRPIRGEQLGHCRDDYFPPARSDPSGLICPFASHIRKTNPRDDPGIKSHRHRLLRRGIPFGAPYPDPSDKGLLFLAYMTSIERQFEYVFKNWINRSDFPESDSGADPIIGFDNGRSVPFTFKLRTSDGIIKEISTDVPPDLVTITSGGYFFAPSISALRFLAI